MGYHEKQGIMNFCLSSKTNKIAHFAGRSLLSFFPTHTHTHTYLNANSNACPMVNVISEANLFDMKTKHSWVSSFVDEDWVEPSGLLPRPFELLSPLLGFTVLAIKLKNFLTPFSSAQYDILCNGN